MGGTAARVQLKKFTSGGAVMERHRRRHACAGGGVPRRAQAVKTKPSALR